DEHVVRASVVSGTGVDDGEQTQLARGAAEDAAAALGELEPGAGDEVIDRLGNKHLAGLSLGGDAGSDVDHGTADAMPFHLDLSCVHASPDGETEVPERAHDRRPATDRARRTVEDGECPDVRGIDLASAEPAQLGANDAAVWLEGIQRR